MPTSRKLVVPLLLALMLLVAVPAVAAAPMQAADQSRAPISFTLTPEQCPRLDTTVTGTGESFVVVTEKTLRNGTYHLVANNVVVGTAVDSNGVTYRFNYHNHFSLNVPPGEFPAQIRIVDHFNLVGAGSANQLHTSFVLVITFTQAGEIDQFVTIRGDPEHCDPI